MTDSPPKIDNAPGLVWKPRMAGWEARWQGRTDLIRRGYTPKSARLWKGAEPTEQDRLYIVSRCRALQDAMLLWGRGGEEVISDFVGNVRSLIACYELDPDSSYRKLRYKTRENYGSLTRRIMKDCGEVELKTIQVRDLLRWHRQWTATGHIAMGHSLVGMLRTLVSFGKTVLNDPECRRIKDHLHDMRFQMTRPRSEQITANQVNAVRSMLHKMGLHSIALAQAGQFDFTWRQKDLVGEWVPISEPGFSYVTSGNDKWLRGARWEEIDKNLIITHVTSKKQKKIVIDIKLAGMVMEELRRFVGLPPDAVVTRDMLPATGPIIVSELTGIPWTASEFRRQWRKAAGACGIPKHIYNMDSRAGAITEGLIATGGDLDAVRIAATHSNVATTQGYSRGEAGRVAAVMEQRAAHRNKGGTSGTGTDGE